MARIPGCSPMWSKEARAKDCNYEYRDLAYAFRELVRPNLDPEIMKQVVRTEWLPPAPEE